MGHNTAVLLLNDAIHGVQEDPKGFTDALMDAWHKFQRNHGNPTDFPVGNHGNGGTVFHESHADVTSVYAVGGNHTSKLYTTHNGGKHYTDEERLKLLKELAAEMGYNIVKKPKKRKK